MSNDQGQQESDVDRTGDNRVMIVRQDPTFESSADQAASSSLAMYDPKMLYAPSHGSEPLHDGAKEEYSRLFEKEKRQVDTAVGDGEIDRKVLEKCQAEIDEAAAEMTTLETREGGRKRRMYGYWIDRHYLKRSVQSIIHKRDGGVALSSTRTFQTPTDGSSS